MVNHLQKKFRTVDEAEDAYGITIDSYLGGPEAQKENQVPHAGIPEKVMDLVKKLTGCQLSMLATHIMENLAVPVLQSTLMKLLPKVLPSMCLSDVTELLSSLSRIASRNALLSVADSLVSGVASKTGLSWNVMGFLDTACRAMCELEAHGKPNVVYFLCRCIAGKKEDGKTPILPLDRMPFGLIQYQLEFFNATHVCQVIFHSEVLLFALI